MSKMYEKLQKCVSIIREKTDFVPEVALILGSGLGEYASGRWGSFSPGFIRIVLYSS